VDQIYRLRRHVSEIISYCYHYYSYACVDSVHIRSRLILYLSGHSYNFITNIFSIESLVQLSAYCAEFLVHGVDVEGKRAGIEEELVTLLGMFSASPEGIPVTYAGGVRTLEDLELVRRLGQGAVDCTVGSALDIFGGDLSYEEVVQWHKKQQQQHL